jgi:TolB-like protein/DNA-binding winged helix-turn-helix (wHTH) protein
MPAERSPTLRFADFEVDLRGHTLHRRGHRVPLQEKAFRLLALLLERPGEAITREALRLELWPADTNVEFEDGLNHVVRRLRAALRDSAEAPRFIETLPRYGYRFIAPVEPVTGPPAGLVPNVPVAEATRAATNTGSAEPAEAGRTRRWRRRAAVIAGATVTAAIAVALGVSRVRSPATAAGVSSIAVLPFRSLAGTDEGERFAEGMTDALITDLARHSELRVVSRTSVMRYAGTRQSATEIGRELAVDAIVEATVQPEHARLRVNVQLVDAHGDRHLWADRYDRDLHDVLRLQQELAAAIATRVLGAVQRSPDARARTVEPEAYLAYVRARHLSERPEPGRFEAAGDEYRRAIRLDAGYAPSYAWLARHLVRDVHANRVAPRLAFPEIDRLARRALEIEPGLAEAEVALGTVRLYYDWDWAAAESALAAAAHRLPADGEAQAFHAELLAATGRTREAVDVMRKAVELFPGVLAPRSALAQFLYLDRRHAEAVHEAQAMLDLDSRMAFGHIVIGFSQLASGNPAAARVAFEQGLGDAPEYAGLVGHARARAGDVAGARAVLATLERRSKSAWVAPVQFALVHAALGENDAAFRWLDRGLEERDHDMAFIGAWPMFDLLRGDPRFGALLRRLQLG